MRDPFRQKHPDAPKTRQDIEDELTAANALKPFEEFPKSIYHPDASLNVGDVVTVETQNARGERKTVTIRARLVASRAEQSKAGPEWLERPQEAVDVVMARDERAAQEFITKVGAEASKQAEAEKARFDKAVAEEVARQLAEKKK